MADINSAVISGQIFKMWDEKQSKQGTPIRGAVLESEKFNGFKSRFDLSAFGDNADRLGSFKEGDYVVVQYELDMNSYKKDDGDWVNKVLLNVRHIKALASGPVAVAATADPSDDDYPF